MKNWSDYPIFMAIAETGSLTAAGSAMGISQPTVGRRLKALEDSLGGPVVKKEDGKLVPTAFGHSVLEHVRRMDEEAAAISRSSATLEHSLAGPIVISATHGIGDKWLPFVLMAFKASHPNILIDINVDMRTSNLAQREADIALRWMGPGTQNSLIGRKAASCGFGFYASPEYIKKHGSPHTPLDLTDHDGVTVTKDGHDMLWKETSGTELIRPRRFAFRTNSGEAHKNAIIGGYGIGPLPHCSIGTSDLVRVLPDFEKAIDLWVVAHEDLRKSARIRAAYDFIVEALQRDSAHMRHGTDSCFIGACNMESYFHKAVNLNSAAEAAQ